MPQSDPLWPEIPTGVARHRRDAAAVDADRRQGAAGADTLGSITAGRCRFTSRRAASAPRRCPRGTKSSRSNSTSSTIGSLTRTSSGLERRCPGAADGRRILRRVTELLRGLGIGVAIDEMPNELPIRSDSPRTAAIAPTMRPQRIASGARSSRRIGSSSGSVAASSARQPGAFLLGQLRSGGDALLRPPRPAPGGVPGLPDAVTREAYSHEVEQRGLLARKRQRSRKPRSTPMPTPSPPATDRPVTDGARFEPALGEFVLPYETVPQIRRSRGIGARIPLEHLRGRGGHGKVGPSGAGVSTRRPGQSAVAYAALATGDLLELNCSEFRQCWRVLILCHILSDVLCHSDFD